MGKGLLYLEHRKMASNRLIKDEDEEEEPTRAFGPVIVFSYPFARKGGRILF